MVMAIKRAIIFLWMMWSTRWFLQRPQLMLIKPRSNVGSGVETSVREFG